MQDYYVHYQDLFSKSGCVMCGARKPDRLCIPKGFVIEGTIEGPPIMFILGRPSGEDESEGRLLSSAEKNKFKEWIREASGGQYPTLVVTAALRCNSKDDKAPGISDIRTCSYVHLFKEICFVRPTTVVTFGDKALQGVLSSQFKTIQGDKFLHQYKTSIGHVNFSNKQDINIYALYHPSYFEMGMGGDKEELCINMLKQAFIDNSKCQQN